MSNLEEIRSETSQDGTNVSSKITVPTNVDSNIEKSSIDDLCEKHVALSHNNIIKIRNLRDEFMNSKSGEVKAGILRRIMDMIDENEALAQVIWNKVTQLVKNEQLSSTPAPNAKAEVKSKIPPWRAPHFKLLTMDEAKLEFHESLVKLKANFPEFHDIILVNDALAPFFPDGIFPYTFGFMIQNKPKIICGTAGGPCEDLKPSFKGIYLIDIVSLPESLRSPEFIKTLTKRCFNVIDDQLSLKSKYDKHPYVSREGELADFRTDIPLKGNASYQSLIPLCHNWYSSTNLSIFFNSTNLSIFFNFMMKIYDTPSIPPSKYGILGVDKLETVYQRLVNLIFSGRCDRVLGGGSIGPGAIDTAERLVGDAGLRPKRAHILGEDGKWKDVICD